MLTPETTYPETNVVKKNFIVRNIWELLRYFTAGRQEHAIGHFPSYQFNNQSPTFQLVKTIHDICLVNSSHPLSSARLSIMEGTTCNPFRGIPCDEFGRLYYALDNLKSQLHIHQMERHQDPLTSLDTRIFTLRVFTNEDSVHIVVGSFETFDRHKVEHWQRD
jgi:hypothetical protein